MTRKVVGALSESAAAARGLFLCPNEIPRTPLATTNNSWHLQHSLGHRDGCLLLIDMCHEAIHDTSRKGKKEKREFKDAAKPGRADWIGTVPRRPVHLCRLCWSLRPSHSAWLDHPGAPSAGFSFEPSPEPELKTRTKAPCCKLLQIGYHLTHSNLTSWQHSLAAPWPSSSPVSP